MRVHSLEYFVCQTVRQDFFPWNFVAWIFSPDFFPRLLFPIIFFTGLFFYTRIFSKFIWEEKSFEEKSLEQKSGKQRAWKKQFCVTIVRKKNPGKKNLFNKIPGKNVLSNCLANKILQGMHAYHLLAWGINIREQKSGKRKSSLIFLKISLIGSVMMNGNLNCHKPYFLLEPSLEPYFLGGWLINMDVFGLWW